QTGTYADIYWARGGNSPETLPDGSTERSADNEVIIHNGGTFTRHTMHSTVVSLHHDGTTLHVVCAFGSYVTVYRLDGAHVEDGPSADLVYHGLGRPGACRTMPRDSTLRLLDASGGVVADNGWPSAAAW